MNKQFKPLTPYRVTKGNTDGNIFEKDLIWFSENGILNCATGNSCGFLMPDELTDEIMDFEAKVDNAYEVYVTPYSEGVKKRAI